MKKYILASLYPYNVRTMLVSFKYMEKYGKERCYEKIYILASLYPYFSIYLKINIM